ncbi:MAG: hypothetical protein M3R55_03355 [Acidobacteriota bacterium]|nr:hypothetical protein [Acidobacteriota bacterium]
MARHFEGRRVVGVVLAAIALTAVIPPAAATMLAQWRVARAYELADAAAPLLATRRQELIAEAGAQGILCGPGRLPRGEGVGIGWVRAPVSAGAAFAGAWPQDPWGRCYLLNVESLMMTGTGLMISAGPNGTIDTAVNAAVPAGDDIGALVR